MRVPLTPLQGTTMNRKALIALLVTSLSPIAAHATLVWTPSLTDWTLSVNNGVAYVNATNMPTYCLYSRAQIDTSATVITPTNQRDLYAFVLASYMAGKPLTLVVNDAETTCKIYGAGN